MDDHDQLKPFRFSTARASHSGHSKSDTEPLDRPSFTFIDHDDDLTSKRIKDVNARKAIRSHVMRDVRRRERLAGLKRTSRRESRSGPPANIENNPHKERNRQIQPKEEQRLVLRSAPESSVPSSFETEHSITRYRRGRHSKWTTGYPYESHLNPNPRCLPSSWFSDPFCTLPGTSELPAMVAHLLYYWKSVFVPITFPNEIKGQETKEVELMVRSSFSDPGSFFGLMSMCAAHRAALSFDNFDVIKVRPKNIKTGDDPDYCIMKAKCIQEMNVKVRDPAQALSNEAFDTIVNLLTGSLIAGLFDEARIHLTGLRRMVDLRGGITDESIRSASMLAAIITADVKAGSGLLLKPVFPLTWDSEPVPPEIQQRIHPPPSSPLHQLGSGFFANSLLSTSLIQILTVIRDVIFYGIAITQPINNISPSDHHFFRVLNCESEHQLLSYIYTSTTPDSKNPPQSIHPIESITRVATICFLNNFLIVSPSSSGLGRALTKHLIKALSTCKIPYLLRLPKENLGLYAWALFVGARGSLGQRERGWFLEQLGSLACLCGWSSWGYVERILSDYFFVKGQGGEEWRVVWDEAVSGFVLSEEVVELG